MRYLVTGDIGSCYFSQWATSDTHTTIHAATPEAAISDTLRLYQAAAEQQDPEATVCWLWPERVRVELVRERGA